MPFEKTPQPRPDKWEITFEDEETISIWKYNKKKFPNGPIEVEIFYPNNSKHRDQILEEENSKLPLTKRKYNNPATGKNVNYFRYMQLIKEGKIIP